MPVRNVENGKSPDLRNLSDLDDTVWSWTPASDKYQRRYDKYLSNLSRAAKDPDISVTERRHLIMVHMILRFLNAEYRRGHDVRGTSLSVYVLSRLKLTTVQDTMVAFRAAQRSLGDLEKSPIRD